MFLKFNVKFCIMCVTFEAAVLSQRAPVSLFVSGVWIIFSDLCNKRLL